MKKIRKSFEEKKTKKLFFLWQNNSKSFEKKKNPYRKNANCVIRTCAGYHSARENACPTGSTGQEES